MRCQAQTNKCHKKEEKNRNRKPYNIRGFRTKIDLMRLHKFQRHAIQEMHALMFLLKCERQICKKN